MRVYIFVYVVVFVPEIFRESICVIDRYMYKHEKRKRERERERERGGREGDRKGQTSFLCLIYPYFNRVSQFH